jgi:hypothetical protein
MMRVVKVLWVLLVVKKSAKQWPRARAVKVMAMLMVFLHFFLPPLDSILQFLVEVKTAIMNMPIRRRYR